MRTMPVIAGIVGVVAIAAGYMAFRGDKATVRPGLLRYDDEATITAGQTVYRDYCAACHGTELQGDPDWRSLGDDGRMRPPPHNIDGHTWHHADAILFEITKFGTAAYVGSGYQSNMGGFDGMLSDAQILATLAYIKSTWPDRTIEIHNDINASAESLN